jgi:hypothetical protein
MADAKSFDEAAGALAGICREAANQNDVKFTAMMAYAQANLTQESLRSLIQHLAEMNAINLKLLDANTEKCFRERLAQMSQGPALILPAGAVRRSN